MRTVPFHCLPEFKKCIDEMLAAGVIERSTLIPWCSPVNIVKKKDEKIRITHDFRKLNEWIVKNSYPVPNIIHLLRKLGKANVFTSVVNRLSKIVNWLIYKIKVDLKKINLFFPIYLYILLFDTNRLQNLLSDNNRLLICFKCYNRVSNLLSHNNRLSNLLSNQNRIINLLVCSLIYYHVLLYLSSCMYSSYMWNIRMCVIIYWVMDGIILCARINKITYRFLRSYVSWHTNEIIW